MLRWRTEWSRRRTSWFVLLPDRQLECVRASRDTAVHCDSIPIQLPQTARGSETAGVFLRLCAFPAIAQSFCSTYDSAQCRTIQRPLPIPAETNANADAATDVYAVHGADPEVLAYGMAKYSRSALSLRESLAELNEQKAEKFLNTFYFQYGHRSIADLAHLAFAVEKLSILAATVVVDEPRWDGQERSTRYQDFQKSGYLRSRFWRR